MRAFSVVFATITALALITSVSAAEDQHQNQQQQGHSVVNPRSFATKTAYWDQRAVADYDLVALATKWRAREELKGLKLLQVQQINRHGTRCVADVYWL